MIMVKPLRNNEGRLYGFTMDGHGDTLVCAAASALALNAVNSIEAFCDVPFECEHRDAGGFLSFIVPSLKGNRQIHDVNLLLESFLLGVRGLAFAHPEDIGINNM